MLTVKVLLRDAEKVKQYLFEKKLFDNRFVLERDKEYIYFPIIKKFSHFVPKIFLSFQERRDKIKICEEYDMRKVLEKKLTKKELEHLKTAFDIVGDIAILEIDDQLVKKQKLIAKTVLALHSNIKTVVKKKGEHKGKLRLQEHVYLAGEKKKETLHRENGIVLKLDIDKAYYSPRMANERKRIMEQVKKGETVLVMFSGIGPYCCVFGKNSLAKEVYGIELNKAGHKYAIENVQLNKLQNVMLLQGDVHNVVKKFVAEKKVFDRILMPLPKGAEDFFSDALAVAHKNTIIHFYDFLYEKDFDKALRKIEKSCKKAKKKYKILRLVKCGQHSP